MERLRLNHQTNCPGKMSESKKFNPAKRKKLNNPLRLDWLPPALIWKMVNSAGGSTFVDIGAGTGFITREIAVLAEPSVHIHALDIEPLMIEEMQLTLPADTPVQPQLMTRDQLPFADAAVDGIWMITLYHELEPPEPLLQEIRRILRPGGCLLIVDWEKNEEACAQGPPLDHRVEIETARQQVETAGFHNVKTVPGFHFHFGITAQV